MATVVTACRCPRCGDEIYSRARHDFRVCSCGAIFVDGGLEPYSPRCGFLVKIKPGWAIKTREINVAASRAVLFNDYNTGTDNFGRITACKGELASEQGTQER